MKGNKAQTTPENRSGQKQSYSVKILVHLPVMFIPQALTSNRDKQLTLSTLGHTSGYIVPQITTLVIFQTITGIRQKVPQGDVTYDDQTKILVYALVRGENIKGIV